MVRQKAIMDLALQFDNASTTKEDLRKAYEKSLREALEEASMDEKVREKKSKQNQADDEEFFLEFGVVRYDSDYESD
nr:hypothetical protein [Tanacetum cinerariifolium]